MRPGVCMALSKTVVQLRVLPSPVLVALRRDSLGLWTIEHHAHSIVCVQRPPLSRLSSDELRDLTQYRRTVRLLAFDCLVAALPTRLIAWWRHFPRV